MLLLKKMHLKRQNMSFVKAYVPENTSKFKSYKICKCMDTKKQINRIPVSH